jgi:hypothetical protein
VAWLIGCICGRWCAGNLSCASHRSRARRECGRSRPSARGASRAGTG